MIEQFIPTWTCSKYNKINLQFLKKNNIKLILSDLDNTLIASNEKVINEDVKKFIDDIKRDFDFCIVSNNKEERVKIFLSDYKCDYYYKVGKPKIKKLQKILEKYNVKREEVLIIGDQVLTDIWCANKLKINSILVNPISKRDLLKTKPNRFLEKIIKRKLRKRNLLKKFPEIDVNG